MIIGIASADHMRADRNPNGVELWGGAGWARIGQYIPHYEAAGHEVHCGILWKEPDGLAVETAKDTKIRPDIILMQRLMVEGVDEAIRYGQDHGQVVINDIDDWYWGLHPENSAFLATHPKYNLRENTEHYAKVLRASDVVTTSTPYLKERLESLLKREVLLIENYVDLGRFTPVEQSADVPTLGWAGSSDHRSNDLETLRGIVKPFIDRGDYTLQHSGSKGMNDSFADRIGCAPHRTMPLVNAVDYPSLLNFDVGIVPLRDTPFNRSKSYIKGLEYAASGIPFVAQSLPEYKRLHEKWGDGFIVADRPKDWIKALKRLTDLDFRLDMQARALKNVQDHDITKGAKLWLSLIEQHTLT